MNEKKLLLIKTALQLFYSNGINSVGISEIVKESGVAKKTLYHHFSSKEQLVLATLKYRDHLFCQWLESILNSKQTGKESILALFYALDNWFNNRVAELDEFKGCYFINTAAEYGDSYSLARLSCKEHKHKISLLIKEKVSMFIKKKDECEIVANAISLLKEGAIVSASVEGNIDAALKCLPAVLRLINEEY
jgi:AcrR family transcriptional regulator